MRIKFASWNVNNRLLQESHLELLSKVNSDILAFQEVNPKFYNALSNTNLFTFSVFSPLLRRHHKTYRKARRLGCALFGKTPFTIVSSFLLDDVPFPERALVVRLKSPECFITACSFHTPPGASWGELKPESHKILAMWLSSQKNRFILGIDANAPKTDHPDITKNEWWWKEEILLLGAKPLHNLKDTLRVYLDSHPDILQSIKQSRPNGPLTVSYIRGNRSRIWCRYDLIYATPDIRVNNVEYLYEESVKAGSNHAMVVSELEVTDVG
ncbi:MAG: endonuclease/exonuclease/phosphatase family protein [Thermodesulfobacteriota bacterium]